MIKMKSGSWDVDIKQESKIKVLLNQMKKPDFLKNLFFSNIFQLLPIWVMLLIQGFTEYTFKIDDYISNLLVFVVIASVINLSDLLMENGFKMNEISALCILFLSFGILCIASIFYSLILLKEVVDLKIRINYLMGCSSLFALLVCLISLYQRVRKER